jgi:hypothetical protein
LFHDFGGWLVGIGYDYSRRDGFVGPPGLFEDVWNVSDAVCRNGNDGIEIEKFSDVGGCSERAD